jgi:hypothetical protein
VGVLLTAALIGALILVMEENDEEDSKRSTLSAQHPRSIQTTRWTLTLDV